MGSFRGRDTLCQVAYVCCDGTCGVLKMLSIEKPSRDETGVDLHDRQMVPFDGPGLNRTCRRGPSRHVEKCENLADRVRESHPQFRLLLSMLTHRIR